MSLLGLLQSSKGIGKLLAFSGSLGGFSSFIVPFDKWVDVARNIELTSNITWNDWEKGLIMPKFNSRWLGGALKKQLNILIAILRDYLEIMFKPLQPLKQ